MKSGLGLLLTLSVGALSLSLISPQALAVEDAIAVGDYDDTDLGLDPLEPPGVSVPLPANLVGVAIEVASVSNEPGTFDLHPRVTISERYLSKGPLFLGGDAVLAPLSGQTSWGQGLIGIGFRKAFPHAYGGLVATDTVYRDTLNLGGSPRGVDDPLYAYAVVEGGELRGWSVDTRGIGLVGGPRVAYSPGAEESALGLGGYIGIQGFYQQAPGWVDSPKSVGQPLTPESTFVGDVGVLYLNQTLWLEASVAMAGGPNIVAFARRNVYGRLSARISQDRLEFSLGLGGARQVNPGMSVLPLGAPGGGTPFIGPPPAAGQGIAPQRSPSK